MKKNRTEFYRKMVENIKTIMASRGLNQRSLAELVGCQESTISKILKYDAGMSFDLLSKIASCLGVNELDLFTYPDHYVRAGEVGDPEPVEAILQIRLQKDKKDQVLRLIFGDNNIEILNK